MDVDKLFKLPSLPSAAVNKRKWNAPQPDDPPSSSSSSSQPAPASEDLTSRPTKAARVEDEEDDEPNGEAEDDTYFFSDDDQEDGRFFGGGLTAEQKQILDIMDSDPNSTTTDPSSTSDLPSLRKQLLRFERAINKNAEMRTKYSSDPTRFIDSEADLDAELKSLLILTTQPILFYPEFVKLGGPASLAGLLSHENADIAASAIEVIEELTDDDVLDSANPDADKDEGEKALEMMNELVEAFLQQSLLDLLVSNLTRFDDFLDPSLGLEESATKAVEVENDAQAIYHTLGAIENLISSRPALLELLVKSTDFLQWTLTRLATKRETADQNTSYAAELLAILLQSSPPNRSALGKTNSNMEQGGENGIDVLLTILSRYRRRNPEGGEEEEFVENIFDSLCLALFDPLNKELFLEGEGVELMVLLMKEKKSFGRVRAVKVLDHATSGPSGGAACERIIEAGGLSPLFSVFIDCNSSTRRGRTTVTMADAEHILGIFVSLFTHLPSESMARIRLLAKFVSDGYEKIDHLLDLRETLTSRLDSISSTQQGEEEEEELYLAKLEQGLFSLQLLDTVLAWVVMEDDAVKDHVSVLLRRKGLGWREVADVLREYRGNIGDDEVSVQAAGGKREGVDGEEELKTKDILSALIGYIEAL